MHAYSYGLKIIFGNVASYSHRYVVADSVTESIATIYAIATQESYLHLMWNQ